MTFKKVKKGLTDKTIIYSGDSSVVIKKDGTPAWRYNNPGNLKYLDGKFVNNHGAIGEQGGFAVFPDAQTGRNSQIALLKTPKYQRKTISDVIKAYSPDGNEANYIRYVTRNTGLSADKKLSNLKTQEFDKLTQAMRRFEHSKPGTKVTLPHPDKVSHILHSQRSKSQGPLLDRTLRRVGEIVYRIENKIITGSFTSKSRRK